MKLFPTSSQMLTSTSTHTVRLAFLFGLIATAILAQDCSNPLLNRTDVQARFGGSANILNTSRVAGNLSVCPFLSGQSVCVSDEGFSALQVFLDQYKQAFTQRSHQADQKRYKGIGNNMKGMSLNNAKTKAVYTLGMLFNYTILSFNATGATQPYNFTAFYTMAQQMGLTVAVNESQSAQQGGQNQGISNHNAQQGGKQGNAGENGQHGQQGNQTQPGNQTQNGTEGNQTQQGPQSGQQQNHGQPGNNNSSPINESNPAGNMSNQTNSTGPQNNQQQQQQSGGPHRLRRLQDVSSNVSEDLNSSATTQQHWDNLQSNLMQAKAKCATSVMKQLYFSSCIAASANFTNATNATIAPNNANSTNSTNSTSSTNISSILSGTGDAPMFKISPDACSAFKSKCLDYFTYSAAAESTRAMIQNAQSSYSEQVYNIVTSTNDTTTINDELNTLATTILAEMNAAIASGNASTKVLSSLSCNSTNSNASDCNYICTNVLNATGFNEDSFSLVSSSSSSSSNSSSTRRLSSSSSSGSITIDANGANPDTTISDSDSAVVVSVSSNPDSSFGFKKTVSVLFVVVSMFGGLFF